MDCIYHIPPVCAPIELRMILNREGRIALSPFIHLLLTIRELLPEVKPFTAVSRQRYTRAPSQCIHSTCSQPPARASRVSGHLNVRDLRLERTTNHKSNLSPSLGSSHS